MPHLSDQSALGSHRAPTPPRSCLRAGARTHLRPSLKGRVEFLPFRRAYPSHAIVNSIRPAKGLPLELRARLPSSPNLLRLA